MFQKRIITCFGILIFIACAKELKSSSIPQNKIYQTQNSDTVCIKKKSTIQDTVFDKTNILASFFYNDSCKIKRIELITKLDERSGLNLKENGFSFVLVDIGLILNDINILLQKKEKRIKYDAKTKKLYTIIDFKSPSLDSINYIALKTFYRDKSKKGRILSNMYAYYNSMELIGKKNTYLDYNAFKNQNVRFESLSKNNKPIDSLLVTVKVNRFIDEITSYKIKINNHTLKYKYSIKADFKESITKDKGCKLYNVLKMEYNFLQFKLAITELNLDHINTFKVYLNDEGY